MGPLSRTFEKFDTFLFRQIDRLKAHPQYINFTEQLSQLDDEVRLALNQLMTLLLLAFPFVVIFLAVSSNGQMRERLQKKEDILSYAQALSAAQSQLSQGQDTLIQSSAASSIQSFQSQVLSRSPSMGISEQKLSFINFDSSRVSTSIVKAEAQLKFSELTWAQLINLFSTLSQQLGFMIEDITITKNPETQALQGSIGIAQLGRQEGR